MNWDILKKNKYFNPYKEYAGFGMVWDGTRDSLPNKRTFEKVQIEYNHKDGTVLLIFEKNRLIIALKIILNFLFDETTHQWTIIDKISFNNILLYDKNDYPIWKKSYDLESKAIERNETYNNAIRDSFALNCEILLKEKNVFNVQFKENPDYLKDKAFSKYYSNDEYLLYKTITGYDDEYFLRETLDEWKIK